MTQKAIINDEVIEIINTEVEREKNERDFPHICFGRITRDDALKLATEYKGVKLNIVTIEENKKLGRDYDIITIQTNSGIAGFRRKYLNIL